MLLFSFVSAFLFFIGSFLPFSFEQLLPLELAPLFAESLAPSLFPLAFISFAILFALKFRIIPFQNPKRAVHRHIPVCRTNLYWTLEGISCLDKCTLPLCPNLQQQDLTNNWAIGESTGIQTPSVNHKVHNKVSIQAFVYPLSREDGQHLFIAESTSKLVLAHSLWQLQKVYNLRWSQHSLYDVS